MSKPNFDELRAERNRRTNASIEEFAKKLGCNPRDIGTTFNPNACYCDCGNGGPCEHKWDGEVYESEDGRCWSATCSRCGGYGYESRSEVSAMMRFLKSTAHLLLLMLAIAAALVVAACVLAAIDPLHEVPYVSARSAT